jgi:hypothetical protein
MRRREEGGEDKEKERREDGRWRREKREGRREKGEKITSRITEVREDEEAAADGPTPLPGHHVTIVT